MTSARTSRNGSLGQIFEVTRGAGAGVVAQVLEKMTTEESGSPGHRDSVTLHLAPLGGVSGSLVLVLRVTHVRRDPRSWASQGGCSASTVLSVPVAPAATAESAGATLRDPGQLPDGGQRAVTFDIAGLRVGPMTHVG